jgi:DNA-binding Lrp family transcriptional regulator
MENRKESKEYVLDSVEKSIIRELIRNPQISDNSISKNTKIPLKTVNRKRKKLEKSNIIFYATIVNNYEDGTKTFNSTQQFKIEFNYGISKKQITTILLNKHIVNDPLLRKHIIMDWIGEKDAKVSYNAIISSRVEGDIIEILNLEIIPRFKTLLNSDCISNIEVISNIKMMKFANNYYPKANIKNGRMDHDEKNENIFVSE